MVFAAVLWLCRVMAHRRVWYQLVVAWACQQLMLGLLLRHGQMTAAKQACRSDSRLDVDVDWIDGCHAE